MIRAALKGVLAHKVRLALTALAIVAGVSFVSGTFVLTDTLQRSFDDLFTVVNRGIDVVVRAEAGFTSAQSFGSQRERVPEEVLEVVQSVPGVAAAQGTVTGFAQFLDKDGEPITPQAPTFAVSVGDEPALEIATLRSGRAPRGPDEVAIDANTATTYGFTVGDRVTILFPDGKRDFTVVGIFGFDELDTLLGATVAAFDIDTAQALLGAEGEYDTIEVAAEPGVTAVELAGRISSVLPEGIEVITQESLVAEQSEEVRAGFLSIFNVVLLVFAGIAIFVGAFIIANTFSIIVAQRLRELALLRAIGATARQITGIVIIETLVVGFLASAVGVVGGIGVAAGLKGLFAGFGIDLPSTGIVLLPRTVVVGMVVGVTVTVVAALRPAFNASRIPPIAALGERYEIQESSFRRRILGGGAVGGLGVLLLLLGLFTEVGDGLVLVGVGAAGIFLGVAVASPLFVGRISQIIGAPIRRMFGITGRLAQDNAARKPARTAATSAALMIGLALVGFALIFAGSLRASATRVIDQGVTADFVVTPNGFQPFPAVIAEEMNRLPEVAVATGVRPGQAKIGDDLVFVNAVDPDAVGEVLRFDFVAGGLDRLGPETIVLREEVATSLGIQVGDEIDVEFSIGGVVSMPVAGIFTGDVPFVGDYVIAHDTFDRHFLDALDQVVFVAAAPGVDIATARQALDRVVDEYPLVKVEDLAEFRASTEAQVNQLLGLVSAMLGLALIIALLGITNTLSLSVYERRREIGLLRAVGMTRRQARRMVTLEAIIVSLFGVLLGVAIGIFFAWAVVTAAADQGFTEFAIPWGSLTVGVVLAVVAGVVAAWSPARRAAKLDILEAIAYE